jgi:uncharacterized glyoxalase superfamily protein PhnB
MNIPNGHQVVMPYLMVNGAARLIDFVTSVFNGVVTFTRMRDDKQTVMHAEVRINGGTLMFCDSTEEWKPALGSLFIYVENADETYAKAISNGAETVLDLKNENYGRTCGIRDPLGNLWWITSVKS